MTPTINPPVAGLPTGVELVRLGTASTEDYELVNDSNGVHIYKGPRVGAASGVIVQPADGYSFRFDIRSMAYFTVKNIDPKTITATVKFTVTNDYDQQSVEVLLERLKSMAGFVSIEQS